MLSDQEIIDRDGSEEDIATHAHDVGYACMYPYAECDICKNRLGTEYHVIHGLFLQEDLIKSLYEMLLPEEEDNDAQYRLYQKFMKAREKHGDKLIDDAIQVIYNVISN